jgi:hypothetical protein
MNVDPDILGLPDQERLLRILVDGRIRGFATFGSSGPVVCFTESTKAAVTTLIREGRYAPCGIGFSKQFVFERGGGPALYVRGDEWLEAIGVPQPLRSRMVRFWPGEDLDPGELLPYNRGPSEWLHEREWRVPTQLNFDWADVEFLIVPHPRWQEFYASWIDGWADGEYGYVFRSIPAVVIDAGGNVLQDGAGIWTP